MELFNEDPFLIKKGTNYKYLVVFTLVAVVFVLIGYFVFSLIEKEPILEVAQSSINYANDENFVLEIQQIKAIVSGSRIPDYSTPFVIYKVKPGDTLSSISYRFNISSKKIVSFNNLINPNLIFPKDILIVPVKKEALKVRIASTNSLTFSKYLSFDLRTESILTSNEINLFLKGTGLDGLGQTFIDAEMKYGVNAKYLMAHAIHESDWGRSKIALDKNNIFGFKAYDRDPYNSAMSFDSFEESINHAAKYIYQNYLSETGKYYFGSNLIGMNKKYASSDSWSTKIARIMEKFDKNI